MVFASPKWYLPPDTVFDIKTTSLIRPHLGSPKDGLNIGILLYIYNHVKRGGTSSFFQTDLSSAEVIALN